MPRPSRSVPSPLSQAAQRFSRWRKTRTTHTIPASLWSLATRLGSEYGVSRTSRVLGVSFNDLKKRVAATGSSSSEKPASPAFVEVPSAPVPCRPECVVELEDGSGAKMRIRVTGGSLPDLAALSRLFLEERA